MGFDHTAWWPVIQAEGWDATIAFDLLGCIERNLYPGDKGDVEGDDG